MNKLDEALELARKEWIKALSGYEDSLGCIDLPQMPMLLEHHLHNCSVLPHRDAVIAQMKIGGRIAEVGVQTGAFSHRLLALSRPEKLHLIDIDLTRFEVAAQFKSEISEGRVQLHETDSVTALTSVEDDYFDFVYIDADHSYGGVKRDIQAAIPKVKQDGFLVFNDYTYWSPTECLRYGVIQAVNELCIEEAWEFIYFALSPLMYCDVALRRQMA